MKRMFCSSLLLAVLAGFAMVSTAMACDLDTAAPFDQTEVMSVDIFDVDLVADANSIAAEHVVFATYEVTDTEPVASYPGLIDSGPLTASMWQFDRPPNIWRTSLDLPATKPDQRLRL